MCDLETTIIIDFFCLCECAWIKTILLIEKLVCVSINYLNDTQNTTVSKMKCLVDDMLKILELPPLKIRLLLWTKFFTCVLNHLQWRGAEAVKPQETQALTRSKIRLPTAVTFEVPRLDWKLLEARLENWISFWQWNRCLRFLATPA